MSSDFDARKHPRGQPDNPGKFKRRLLPTPPLARRRRRHEPVAPAVSVEEIARDAVAKPEKCRLCRGYVVIVSPQPDYEPVGWCHCGDRWRADIGLPLMSEIVNEIVRQGRLPVPNCPYCGVKLECGDPSVHIQGLHGRECHASRHFPEDCENPPDIDGSWSYPLCNPVAFERGSSDTDPPPRKLRKAQAAERVAGGALVLAVGAATIGWSSTPEVQLLTWAAVVAAAVLTVRALPELRQRWREGTQLKEQGQRMRVENELLSELNGHLSRLVAHATAAGNAIKAFDDGTEQSDQQDPVRKEMVGTMRRALVDEAQERVAAARAATGRAQAVAVLPYRERIDAITELNKELEATSG